MQVLCGNCLPCVLEFCREKFVAQKSPTAACWLKGCSCTSRRLKHRERRGSICCHSAPARAPRGVAAPPPLWQTAVPGEAATLLRGGWEPVPRGGWFPSTTLFTGKTQGQVLRAVCHPSNEHLLSEPPRSRSCLVLISSDSGAQHTAW